MATKRQRKTNPMPGMKLIRLARQMSQKELSLRVGCHNQTISRIESGYNNPTTALLERIALVLECDIRMLY